MAVKLRMQPTPHEAYADNQLFCLKRDVSGRVMVGDADSTAAEKQKLIHRDMRRQTELNLDF